MAQEQPQMGLTFEQVWATIQRIAEKHEELAEQHKETERFLKESKAETDKAIKELTEQHKELAEQHKELAEQHKELAEQHKETELFFKESKKELNQAVGKLTNKFGELVEHLVSPNLLEKFRALDYRFTRTNTRVKYKDQNTGKTIAEVDVLLENGDIVLVLEIKADPAIEDVKDHTKRMETLRAYADLHDDKRKYQGAIAGGIVSDSVKNYALKSGFYVLEQSGDTITIVDTPDSWKPKTW